MKRKQRLLILSAVLAVICLATVLVSKLQPQTEQIRQTQSIVLQVPQESVTRISWQTEDDVLAFKKDAQWLYEGDSAFPVSEAKLGSVLELFAQFGVSFTIEAAKDLGQYGLSKPVCTVTLETADTSYEIRFGDFSAMDEKRYAWIGDGNVYLLNDDPVALFGTLPEFLENDTVPEFEAVTSLSVTGAAPYKASAVEENIYTYSQDDRYFREDTRQALDTDKVKNYFKSLQALALTEYLTYNCTEADLEGCGLNTPQMLLTVTHGGGEFSLAASEKDGSYYARFADSAIIYQLTKQQYDTVCGGSFDSLRHEKLFYGEFRNVDRAEFMLDGESHIMDITGDYAEQTWYYEEKEVSAAVLQTALSALRVSSFTDESPAQKQELSVTLSLDSPHCPTVTISLYRYDGSYCLAAINEKTVGFVPREDVVNMIEYIHQIILG